VVPIAGSERVAGEERVLRGRARQPPHVIERELVRARGIAHGFGFAHHKLWVSRESHFSSQNPVNINVGCNSPSRYQDTTLGSAGSTGRKCSQKFTGQTQAPGSQ